MHLTQFKMLVLLIFTYLLYDLSTDNIASIFKGINPKRFHLPPKIS